MNILINASNLKIGGGLQVADSICRELFKFSQHYFIVVLSSKLTETKAAIQSIENLEVYQYDVKNNLPTLLLGRDKFLDELVVKKRTNAVLTIFGPSRWIPKVPHLSGFARGHLVLPDSPYWKMLPLMNRIKMHTRQWIMKQSLNRCADYYFTENPFISERLQKLFPRKKIFTVTNNVNQVFLQPHKWERTIKLPSFDGLSILTVAANYPHKNLPILMEAARWLKSNKPDLKFRFVLTIKEDNYVNLDQELRNNFLFLGPVDIAQVPSLYNQTDIMLMPTLLECFSASYAEAMIMHRPILTTNLSFAKSLCGNAALYYDAVSACSLGESIVKLATDTDLRSRLVQAGEKQIKKFDTFEQRAEKLINLVSAL